MAGVGSLFCTFKEESTTMKTETHAYPKRKAKTLSYSSPINKATPSIKERDAPPGGEDKKKNSQLLTDKEKRKKIYTYEKLLEAVEAFGLKDLGAHRGARRPHQHHRLGWQNEKQDAGPFDQRTSPGLEG